MPQVIEVPGYGPVEFPDGMTDEQIGAAIIEDENARGQSMQPVASLPQPGFPTAMLQPNVPVNPMLLHEPLRQAPQPISEGQQLAGMFKSFIPPEILALPGQAMATLGPLTHQFSPEVRERLAGGADTLANLLGGVISPAGPYVVASQFVPGLGPAALAALSAPAVGSGLGTALYSDDPRQQTAGAVEALAGLLGLGGAGVKGVKDYQAFQNRPRLVKTEVLPPEQPAPVPALRPPGPSYIDVEPKNPLARLQLKGPEDARTIRSDQTPLPQQGLPGVGSQAPRSGDLQRVGGGPETASDAVLRGEAPQTFQEGPRVRTIGEGIEAALLKNREAGALFLPGPKMLRERKGINVNPEAKVNGPQLLRKLQGALTKEEFGAYMKAGLTEFLKAARTGNEVAQWMEDNGPRVLVKQYGEDSVQTATAAKLHDMQHNWYDQLPEEHRKLVSRVFGHTREEHDAALKKAGIYEKAMEYYDAYDSYYGGGGENYRPSASIYADARVFPADPKQHRIERIEVTAKEVQQFPANEEHGTSDNSIGWAAVQFIKNQADVVETPVVFEVQSDWQRALDAEAKPDFVDYSRGGPTRSHPLLPDYERLVLKATIDKLREQGYKKVVIADTATAHIAQGSDRMTELVKNMSAQEVMERGPMTGRAQWYKEGLEDSVSKEYAERYMEFDYGPDWREGKYVQMSSAAGEKLPAIYRIDKPENNVKFRIDRAKELAELAPADGPLNRFQAGMEAAHGEKGRYRNYMKELTGEEGVPVSVTKSGKRRPVNEQEFSLYGAKKDVSGLQFSLERATQDQPIFGKGKAEPATTTSQLPGIQINKAMEQGRGQESGAIFIPKFVKDLLQKFIPSPSTKVPPGAFQSKAGRGYLTKFQTYQTEKAMAGEYKGAGSVPGIGRLFDPRAAVRDEIDAAFLTHRAQRSKADSHEALLAERARALKDFLKDKGPALKPEVDSEALLPGSVPGLTAEQRNQVTGWSNVKKQLEQYAQAEGLTRIRTKSGRSVPVTNIDFPEDAKDFYTGIAQRVGEVLRAVADERMAMDPALGGRGRAGLGRGPTGFTPIPQISRRRVFPHDVAKRLEKHFQHGPGSTVEKIGLVNDVMKAAQTAGDLSFLGQQGLAVLARRPDAWGKAFAGSMKALVQPRTLSRYLLHNTKDAQQFTELGGTLAKIEEFLKGARKGGPLRHVPGLGPLAQHLGHSMTTFMSIAKLEMFKALKDTVPDEKLRELVETIELNVGSGRQESIGLSPIRSTVERLIGMAPSYYRAGVSTMANLPRGGIAGKEARKTVGMMVGGLMIAAYGIYTRMGMSEEEKIKRLIPGEKNFLRFPITLDNGDKLEVGPGHIVLALIKLAGDLVQDVTDDDPDTTMKKSLLKFASYRAAPLPKFIDEFRTGKDVMGREVSGWGAAGRSVTPISAQDLVYGKGKQDTRAAEAAISFFGGASRPESMTEMRDRLMTEQANLRGKEWNQLSASERAEITETIKPMMREKRAEQEKPTEDIAIKAAKRRKERLNEGMPDDVKTFLDKHELVLPGYQVYLQHEGETIVLAPEEREELERNVFEGSEKAVRQLMGQNLSGLTLKAKETRLERLLERHVGRFREQFKRRLQK